MQDNPKLEQEIVDNHLNRLEHHFGHNPNAIAFAWNQGITNANRSLKQNMTYAHIPTFKNLNKHTRRNKI